MKNLIIILVIGTLFFGLAILISYLVTKGFQKNFELGWPYKFYYQFNVRNNSGYELNHGTSLVKMLIDWLIFLTIAALFFSVKKYFSVKIAQRAKN